MLMFNDIFGSKNVNSPAIIVDENLEFPFKNYTTTCCQTVDNFRTLKLISCRYTIQQHDNNKKFNTSKFLIKLTHFPTFFKSRHFD